MGNKIIKQLDPIFKPHSIAVIGASSITQKWGFRKLNQAIISGYKGKIYPVNPRETDILGLHTYPNILDIPDTVDLAVITVPADAVPRAMAECVQKGVKGALVITAGFAEIGEKGKKLQDEVVEIARKGNIRFIGPNMLGIWSAVSSLSLSTTRPLIAGNIAFISQSGTFGAHLAEKAVNKGIGLSKFISIGNQADLNVADYIEYLGKDPDTRVIAIYIEGFPQGRRFFEISREVIKIKPIVIYKAGRTAIGARASMSHTSSLAVTEVVFNAMHRQIGLIRVYEAMHIFDIANALANTPRPKGKRIAIIGTGGQCVVTADNIAAYGMEIPEFDREAQNKLQSILPLHAPVPKNPVDWAGGVRTMLAEAELVDQIAQLPYIDAIIARPPLPGFDSDSFDNQAVTGPKSAEILAAIPEKYGKPLIIMRPESTNETIQKIFRDKHIPSLDSPEDCARAMNAIISYAETMRAIAADEQH